MMLGGILTIATFLSVIFSPWPFTALLAVVSSFVEPLLPLAAGLFADTLYYTPQAGTLPLFTLSGLALSLIATFVRNRLRAGIIA